MIDSTTSHQMSLEQFETRLLDGDRWIEMKEGRFTRLNPPDDAHGDVVRNLSLNLATYFKKSQDTYACFELPLIIQREPPTVRCPAISCFHIESAGRFAETDKTLTETRPNLVIEVASSNDRREGMSDRIQSYLEWGVSGVWVIDPVSRHVHIFQADGPSRMLKETEVLNGQPLLQGFTIPVIELFKLPSWANK